MSLDTTYTHQQQNCKNQVTDIYGAQLGAHFVNSTTPNKINISQNVHLNVPVATKRNQNPRTTPSIVRPPTQTMKKQGEKEMFREVMRCSLLEFNLTRSKTDLHKNLQLKSTSAQHASRTMGGGEVLFF
jgi:hypothetical protein